MNWQQFKAILWLRWRLTRNQFRRGGQVNVALSVFGAVMLAIAAVGLGIGGFALGLFAGVKAPAQVLMLIWDGVIFLFLIFWLSGLMVEIQRSESIDLTKLLHLPVSLPQVFAFNFAASHLTPVILLLMPGMLGFCAGLTLGAGPVMILLVPLMLGCVFMISAWTYCLRGWLTAIMTNKRRRRTVIVWLTIGIVLLGQLPNLVFNSPYFRNRTRPPPPQPQAAQTKSPGRGAFALPELLVSAHSVAPPGWVGYGAMELRQGRVLSAPVLAVAGFLIGAMGMIRAYRMTLGFYRGAENGRQPRTIPQPDIRERGQLLVERRLPWLPDDTAALALATFCGLVRAPELKIAFIMPVVLGIVLSTLWFARLKQPPT
jgi:ABC-2 type transport system permease protein